MLSTPIPKVKQHANQEVLAAWIRAAAEELNAAIHDGVAAGLETQLLLLDRQMIGSPDQQIVLVRTIGKLL